MSCLISIRNELESKIERNYSKTQMKLNCYLIDAEEVDIRPASRFREWMDQPVVDNAKRCLPLLMANSHGWEILSPFSFTVNWNGGSKKTDTLVEIHDTDVNQNSKVAPIEVHSHFGGGIITFNMNMIFETEPAINLWVTGPVNYFKDGVMPLSALIEADWMPYSFTMNWKITRKNCQIEFKKGEPICFLFPIQRGLIDSVEPALKHLKDNQVIKKKYDAAIKRRSLGFAFIDKSRQDERFKQHAKKLTLQRWYMKGEMPDGSGEFEEHQTKINVKAFQQGEE